MERRSRYLIFGLTAVLAIVAVTFVLVREITVTSAAADPAMHMTVTEPAGVCSGETCTIPLGQQFKLAVIIDKVPGGGWTLAQSFLDYDDGGNALTYKKPGAGPAADIEAALDCGGFESGGQTTSGELVNHTCITSGLPPVATTYTGQLVAMNFACSAGTSSTLVRLLPLDDPVAAGDGAGFVDSSGAVQYPASDTLTINCGAGVAPTNTPTLTVAAPATATATPTGPTATPTLTSTPGPPTNTPTITLTRTVTGTPTQTPVPPTPTATPETIPGDVDCDGVVDSSDALWVLWVEAGLADLGDLCNPEAADLNGDGVISSIDALFILWIESGDL